jgi:hypothetical protein
VDQGDPPRARITICFKNQGSGAFDGHALGGGGRIGSTMAANGNLRYNTSLPAGQETSRPDTVVVNIEACRRLAGLLSSRTIPAPREDSSLPWMSPKEVGNFYLLLVAICYQTTPRDRPPLEGYVEGLHLRGWDYLSAKLEAASRNNLAILSPGFWARISPEEVRQLFHDDALGDRLSDPAGRAQIIGDLGEKMLRRSWDFAAQMYDAAGGRIGTGNTNLLSLLAQFRAYDDPVRKKSFFFLELMQNAGLWKYVDPGQLGAPVDYHEVRGHLRIGTVEIRDPDLHAKLLERKEVTADQDISIRRAVYEALMLVSEYSGLRNPGQLHYMFWNVFRSCCTRENPHCISCPPTCALPTRYVPLAMFPDGVRRCPFSKVCQSAGREPKLMEHVVNTDYY